MSWTIHTGDALTVLRTLPDASVQCCVTSPPYWGLRNYGHDGQLGLEATPAEYVANLVAVFAEVHRVLRDDGTLWLNLGDCYATGAGKVGEHPGGGAQGARWAGQHKGRMSLGGSGRPGAAIGPMTQPNRMPQEGLKPKDLCGIPWRTAFALQADGWFLRSAITWCKAAPMPESVRDRPTTATEMVFMLTKSAAYFYDQEAERVAMQPESAARYSYAFGGEKSEAFRATDHRRPVGTREPTAGRNLWNYWVLNPDPTPLAHFATMPRELARRCIRLGTSERGACSECGAPWVRVVEKTATGRVRQRATGGLGTAVRREPLGLSAVEGQFQEGVIYSTTGWRPSCDHADAPTVPCVVIDCFSGAGTTLLVADQIGRDAIGIELNERYAEMARRRIRDGAPLFTREVGAESRLPQEQVCLFTETQ